MCMHSLHVKGSCIMWFGKSKTCPGKKNEWSEMYTVTFLGISCLSTISFKKSSNSWYIWPENLEKGHRAVATTLCTQDNKHYQWSLDKVDVLTKANLILLLFVKWWREDDLSLSYVNKHLVSLHSSGRWRVAHLKEYYSNAVEVNFLHVKKKKTKTRDPFLYH